MSMAKPGEKTAFGPLTFGEADLGAPFEHGQNQIRTQNLIGWCRCRQRSTPSAKEGFQTVPNAGEVSRATAL